MSLSTTAEMLPTLRRIATRAEATVLKLEARMKTQVHPPSKANGAHEHPIPTLTLPLPPSITPRLTALGVDVPAAQRISHCLEVVVSRLRNHCLSDYHQRSNVLCVRGRLGDIPFLRATFTIIYQKAIHEWTSFLLNDITPRIKKALSTRGARGEAVSQVSTPRKRPFNQDAVPILELFFETNAFPSRLEKYELAAKCEMDYRQIHVWFQNRRSRFRKEGKELKKRAITATPLQALEDSVVDALLPVDLDDENSARSFGEVGCTPQKPAFRLDAPAHAYPSPFPPLCSYDPFPISGSERHFSLPWIRQTPVECPVRPRVDVSDLVAAFARLTVSDGAPNPAAAEHATSHRSIARRAICHPLGFVVPCPPAPHPALIRIRQASRRHGQPRCPKACRIASPPPGPQTERVPGVVDVTKLSCRSTDVASSTTTVPSRNAHKRGIPRRVPRHPPTGHATQQHSPAIYLSPVQKVPYVESHITSRTTSDSSTIRTASDSGFSTRTSSDSDADSPLSTPLLHSSALPSLDAPVSLAADSPSNGEASKPCVADPLSTSDTFDYAFQGYAYASKVLQLDLPDLMSSFIPRY